MTDDCLGCRSSVSGVPLAAGQEIPDSVWRTKSLDGHGNYAPLAVIAKAVKASLLRAKLGIVTIHEDLKISHHAFAVP
ncbi:hypothetical protein [Ensifer adhaerens]|uniref:hypothetical protein n=1 Tax=Ensifer adhaerens TaxID=106592 RepID=UPI00128EF933|nr:hypothetical protein [Ensifer adhaerens]